MQINRLDVFSTFAQSLKLQTACDDAVSGVLVQFGCVCVYKSASLQVNRVFSLVLMQRVIGKLKMQ